MKLIIYPTNDLWDFVVRGISDKDNVLAIPLNTNCARWQVLARKLAGDANIPVRLLFGKHLRKKLQELNSGDTVVLADYSCLCLHKAIGKEVKQGVKLVWWMWNPMRELNGGLNRIKAFKELGFRVATFDESDAQKYSVEHLNQFFPIRYCMAMPQSEIITDFYFVGFDKGRKPILDDLKHKLSNYRTNFIIINKVEDCIPYEESINNIASSRCVVDVVQGEQTGLTLRPLEALALRKKLLTNNRVVEKQLFYDKNNIFIIGKDDWNDIDVFMQIPYTDVPKDVIDLYDINTWLNNL